MIYALTPNTFIIMVGIKYGALFGWGIAIYAVMYLIGSGLLIYGFAVGIIPVLVKLLGLIGVSGIAGRALPLSNWKDVLPYSVAWAIIAAILDGIFWVPFAGWQLYASYGVWVGYALVALIPVVAVRIVRPHAAAQTTVR